MPRKVRISPSGQYVDWSEEFAGVNLAVLNRVRQEIGPASPVNLLASQAAGQLILEYQFDFTQQQIDRIAADDYRVTYLCRAKFFVDTISVAKSVGGSILAEWRIDPAGATGPFRRYTQGFTQHPDSEAVPDNIVEGNFGCYLSQLAVSNWTAGTNLIQFCLSCPGTATGVVPNSGCQGEVLEFVGNPEFAGQ